MTADPTITDILVVPHTRLTPTPRASIGVVVAHQHVAWRECAVGDQESDIEKSVHEAVAPVWIGRHLRDFDRLLADLDTLTEAITFFEEISAPESEAGISRRALLTGQFWRRSSPSPQTRSVTRTLPLRPQLRYALSLALFTHLARMQGTSLAETITTAYGRGLRTTPTPLLWEQPFPGEITAWPADAAGGAWAWRLSADAPADTGTALQRTLRQTRQQLQSRTQEQWPSCWLVQAQGWFGRTFGGDVGKVLGALYGLERVAKPLPLCIENPFTANAAHLELWRNLREYLDFRDMKIQLALHTADTALMADFLAAGVVSWVRLIPAQQGSLRNTWRIVAQCQEAGVKIVLGDDPTASIDNLRDLAELALAWDAAFITAPLAHPQEAGNIVQVAMPRSLAWQRYRTLHPGKDGNAGAALLKKRKGAETQRENSGISQRKTL